MRSVTNEEAHRLARDKGVSRPLYAIVRVLVTPFMRLYFRMHIAGAEHIPGEGAAIVAPNPGGSAPSAPAPPGPPDYSAVPVRFMAKTELVNARYGRLLVRLGAFPVRRGESDADALETALAVLRQGGLLALFPEGTRVRDPEGLGPPRRGAGRIALEAGAPLVPCAITGTDELFFGPFLKPRRVQVAFSEPIPVHHLTSTPEVAGELVEESLWPQVEGEYRRLRARPTLVAGALAALGVGAGLLVRRRRH